MNKRREIPVKIQLLVYLFRKSQSGIKTKRVFSIQKYCCVFAKPTGTLLPFNLIDIPNEFKLSPHVFYVHCVLATVEKFHHGLVTETMKSIRIGLSSIIDSGELSEPVLK